MGTPTTPFEKCLIGFGALVGLALGLSVLVIAALSTALKLLIVCVVPAAIYVPTRLVLGAPPLPTSSAGYQFTDNSRFGLAISVLFLACLRGYMTILMVFFVVGCLILPFSIWESIFSVRVIPSWYRDVAWPILALAFAGGVTLAAIQDVKAEKDAKQ